MRERIRKDDGGGVKTILPTKAFLRRVQKDVEKANQYLLRACDKLAPFAGRVEVKEGGIDLIHWTGTLEASVRALAERLGRATENG